MSASQKTYRNPHKAALKAILPNLMIFSGLLAVMLYAGGDSDSSAIMADLLERFWTPHAILMAGVAVMAIPTYIITLDKTKGG